MIWFGLVLWLINIAGYLKPIPFFTHILDIHDLIGFYDISTIIAFLMPNTLHTYILNT